MDIKININRIGKVLDLILMAFSTVMFAIYHHFASVYFDLDMLVKAVEFEFTSLIYLILTAWCGIGAFIDNKLK